MKALPILLFALSALAGAAHADMTPAEAFNQGKTFGNTGKGGAGGTVSGASGAANVPKYNTSAPESGYYSGGKGLLGTAGTNKLTACQTYVAGKRLRPAGMRCRQLPGQEPVRAAHRPALEDRPDHHRQRSGHQEPRHCAGQRNGSGLPHGDAEQPRRVRHRNLHDRAQDGFLRVRQHAGYPDQLELLLPGVHHRGADHHSGHREGASPGQGMIPPDATCHVKQPVDVWTCPEGSTGPDALHECSTTTTDENGVETTTKTPATWSQGWNEYDTYADKVPTVVENWDNQCAEKEARSDLKRKPWPDCEETKPKWCTQAPETRYFDGVPVYRGCWQWRKEFGCLTNDSDYDCGPRAHGNCVSQGTTCIQYAIDGKCAITEESYRCEKTPPSTTTHEVCEPSSFCQDDGAGCFSTDRQPDQDFGKAAAMMEASREAGRLRGQRRQHRDIQRLQGRVLDQGLRGHSTQELLRLVGWWLCLHQSCPAWGWHDCGGRGRQGSCHYGLQVRL
jgi:hypothetical protein